MPTELILNKQQYSSLIIKERCDSRTRSSPSLIIVGFSSSYQKIKRKGKKSKGWESSDNSTSGARWCRVYVLHDTPKLKTHLSTELSTGLCSLVSQQPSPTAHKRNGCMSRRRKKLNKKYQTKPKTLSKRLSMIASPDPPLSSAQVLLLAPVGCPVQCVFQINGHKI